ncbi:MAG: hypothetical protein JXM73_10700 [Anaerolineae bacterium]|nr:hypothetical protein [Anaerolineae bacterium]
MISETIAVREDLPQLSARWRRHQIGTGVLEPAGSALRFVVNSTPSRRYSNAQIDDYAGKPRRRFPWRPPLRLTVRARFSHPAGELAGTAGFGFWNDPFLMTGKRVPTLPRAIWFFYASPPSAMKLDLDTPGCGWKAATIDALRPAALLLAPVALPAVLLMNIHPVYRALWPPIQRAIRVSEALLPASMREWHVYVVEWGERHSQFFVDGELLAGPLPSPRGPLGFVMWLDNQYMLATPQGRLGWGVLEVTDPQWMEVEHFAIEPTP